MVSIPLSPLTRSKEPVVFVTGGAGYIGSHTVLELQSAGFKVVVLDNLVHGHRDLVEDVLGAELIVGDIGDRALLDQLFSTYNVTAVIHFAAYAYVGESIASPAMYYRNNVAGTLTLLEAMNAAGIDKIVFSSTCATYGVPTSLPIEEDHPQHPINPYGVSKLTVERILCDFALAYSLRYVVFRYFNAAGADPAGRLGEDHTPETHLIPSVLQAAAGELDSVSIFGSDYPTPDGTCIRDYIHVSDLARAHVLGLVHLNNGGQPDVFNLGNGNGFSVREVIAAVRWVTRRHITVHSCPKRPGDPPSLVGSNVKAKSILGWQPEYRELIDIVTHAWNWHQIRRGKEIRREVCERKLVQFSASMSAV